ncbi:SHOCT domain-containing protein [Spirosoma gilvum]
MKHLLLFLLFLPLIALAQDEYKPVKRRTTPVAEADLHGHKQLGSDDFDYGYQPAMAPGWTIKTGDTLRLGKGTMPDKSFAFIYQDPANLTLARRNGFMGKDYLDNLYAGTRLVVKELNTSGSTAIAIFRSGVRYYIQIENAIEAGELLPPPQFRKIASVSHSTASVADELLKFKQLLDSGAITQQEYDTQKKKLLNQ